MLTQEELERRRSFITATDVPAILGASPWVNAADVYWSKVRGIVKPSNAAMEAGSILEPSILKWAETQLGPLLPGDWRVAENGINACSLDAQRAAGGEVVEAKSSGITGPGSPQQWGEEGTDEVPDYYLLQVQAQLLVTGAKLAFLPALIGGRGFAMFRIEANVSLQGIIQDASENFWHMHVQAHEPPSGTPHFETLKHMARLPGKSVSVSEQIVQEFLEAQAETKAAEKREEDAKAALLAALDDAEEGTYPGGLITYREQTRKGFTVEESTYRVLRHRAKKGALKVHA